MLPIDKRPALSAALASVRRHGAGVLVVAKRDRIARDVLPAPIVAARVGNLALRVTAANVTP